MENEHTNELKANASIIISVSSLIISGLMLFYSILLRNEAKKANEIAYQMMDEAKVANEIAIQMKNEVKEANNLYQNEINILNERHIIDKSNYAVWTIESLNSFEKKFDYRLEAKIILLNYSNYACNIFVKIETDGFCLYKSYAVKDECENVLNLGNYAILPQSEYLENFYIHTRSDKPIIATIRVKTYESANYALLHEKTFIYRQINGVYELEKK